MKVLSLLSLLLLASGLSSLRADDLPGLKGPLKIVTQKYLVIQQKLATDLFPGVTAAATDMKTAIAADKSGIFTPDFAKSVDALAAATDLHSARVAFEDVSNNLIAALAQNKVQTGVLHSVLCPMRKAYWIQLDGQVVHNPYYGESMSDCGKFQGQY